MDAKRPKRRTLLTPLGLLAVLSAVLVLSLIQGQGAHAATISVTTTADELNVDGNCSLREAITAANTDTAVDACSAGSGADIIDVPAGTYTLSIPGANEDANATGDLNIHSDLTISGAGAASTIIQACVSSAGPCTVSDRVFGIFGPPPAPTVTVSGVTIRNGRCDCQGGGINNNGTLTVSDSTVSDNSALAGAGISNSGFGGFGVLTITNSTVSGNSAISGAGGGITNASGGTLTITNSTVSGNSASPDGGGGIFNGNGTVTLTNSTVIGNAANTGGGIENGMSGQFSGTFTITNSTVSGNVTTSGFSGTGGGIANFDEMTITNSTVSGNSSGNSGGGIGNLSSTSGAALTITNSTVSGNSADAGGGIYNAASATLKNAIVANNPSGGDCVFFAPVTSQGHNLSSDGTCAFSGPGDLDNTDPMLGPLADNGGPTQTQALLAGSPAIDASSSDCPPPAGDQRGVTRPQDGDGNGTAVCDIGAFELGGLPTATTSSTPTPTPTPSPTCPSVDDLTFRGTPRAFSSIVDFDTSGSPSGTFTWDFGDGSQGVGAPISHDYNHLPIDANSAGPGEYLVDLSLFVSDNCIPIGTRHVVTADPVRAYSPEVHLDPHEKYFPEDPNTFISRSRLIWDKPDNPPLPLADCKDIRLAYGSQLVPPIIPKTRPPRRFPVINPADLASKVYSAHQIQPLTCTDGPTIVYANDPPSLAKKDDANGAGFELDLADNNRFRAGDHSLNAPMYAEYVPGRYVIYWFFYAYNGWKIHLPLFGTKTENHEGDWEHIVVRLDNEGKATEAAYYQHDCEGDKHSYDTVERNGTHPVVYSALGGHASYANSGTFGAQLLPCFATSSFISNLHINRLSPIDFVGSGGPVWRPTGTNVRDATLAPWYGFGGAWGDRIPATLSNYGPPGPGPVRSQGSDTVPSDWK